MTVEALIFLKSEPGMHKALVEWVARAKDAKRGKNPTYAEPGVKDVFHSEGEYDVIIQVTKSDRKAVHALVREIKRKRGMEKSAVKISRVSFIYHKMPGDP